MPDTSLFVGTAGWSIPTQHAAVFEADGTHLERYARRLGSVEINSSFYRPHRLATYARWAASVPAGFRFAVKMPRAITHEAALAPVAGVLETFLAQVAGLGERLGSLLVQLPPKQVFREVVVRGFFERLRVLHPAGPVVVEPRHASWFGEGAAALLQAFGVSRVVADPPPVQEAAFAAGEPTVRYFRLHGSPRVYYSGYSEGYLDDLAETLCGLPAVVEQAWVIFDNTAAGEAMGDALRLMELMRAVSSR